MTSANMSCKKRFRDLPGKRIARIESFRHYL